MTKQQIEELFLEFLDQEEIDIDVAHDFINANLQMLREISLNKKFTLSGLLQEQAE